MTNQLVMVKCPLTLVFNFFFLHYPLRTVHPNWNRAKKSERVKTTCHGTQTSSFRWKRIVNTVGMIAILQVRYLNRFTRGLATLASSPYFETLSSSSNAFTKLTWVKSLLLPAIASYRFMYYATVSCNSYESLLYYLCSIPIEKLKENGRQVTKKSTSSLFGMSKATD